MAPRFSADLRPQNVTPNSDVVFRVVFEGTPPFTVKWFKDDIELVAGASCTISLKKNSSSVELIAVQALQNGVYSCQVSNEAGTVNTAAELVVKGWTQFFVHIITNYYHHSFSFLLHFFCLHLFVLPMNIFESSFTACGPVCIFRPSLWSSGVKLCWQSNLIRS